jgi:2,3-bisphosphoglycerate-dependent phosphoglycerate mutase
MVTIFFESHGTTFDNENKVASGWQDVRLSPKGNEEAKNLGERYAGQHLDAVFSSDLRRANQTATIAFSFDPKLIFADWRLRECDYGDYTGAPKQRVEAMKAAHLQEPFPNGESYQQCIDRMGSFLADLKARWDGKTVMIIGHRATQYGLEHFLNNKTLEQCVSEPWSWKPGWTYQLP